MATNNGIAEAKNMLGADCFILRFFFFWHLLQTYLTLGLIGVYLLIGLFVATFSKYDSSFFEF
jgi:hypothetical protein